MSNTEQTKTVTYEGKNWTVVWEGQTADFGWTYRLERTEGGSDDVLFGGEYQVSKLVAANDCE